MAVDPSKPSPERERTDESLRTERGRTDRALAEKQLAVEEDADQVVHRARENADAVLEAARGRADEEAPQAATPAVIVELRGLEDEALRAERACADESLRKEREASARALLRLLPLERRETDRYLLTERARSDDDLSVRDDFLGIVSHDLRDLLGAIVMSAEVLARRASGSPDAAATVVETDRIQRYAARMNRLIGDLVDVAAIDAGRLAMAPTEGDAAALLAEAIDTFQAAASAKGISLEADTTPAALPATFDHDRLLQVIANLISNAIKFTPRGGRIRLGVKSAPDALRFSIADTGPGIPAGMLESVFERFWQVGKNDRRGLGLGLYIARSIVEVHGGTIRAMSELGAGSTFEFTLPRLPERD